jgi:chorismate synthase
MTDTMKALAKTAPGVGLELIDAPIPQAGPEDVLIRVAFKPTATINSAQQTVTRDGQEVSLEATGRHDPCVLPRAVPLVEAGMLLVLADHYLRQEAVRAGSGR